MATDICLCFLIINTRLPRKLGSYLQNEAVNVLMGFNLENESN